MTVKTSPLKSVPALAVVGFALAACSSGPDPGADGAATGSTGGSFSFAIAEPEALAPVSTCYETACVNVMRAINVGLVRSGYRKAADLVLEELPAAPLFFEKAYYLHSPRVGNVTYDQANETIDLSKVTVTQ